MGRLASKQMVGKTQMVEETVVVRKTMDDREAVTVTTTTAG